MDLVVKDARIRLILSQIHSNGKGIIQHSFDEAKKAYCQQIILIILNLSYTNAYLTTVIGPQKLKYISYSFEVSNPCPRGFLLPLRNLFQNGEIRGWNCFEFAKFQRMFLDG